jgi:hypothetical protein
LIILNVFKVEDDITKENWFKAYNEIFKFNKYYLEDHVKVDTVEIPLRVSTTYRSKMSI